MTFRTEDLDAACARVASLKQLLETAFKGQWQDLVPAYNTLRIFVPFPKVYPQVLERVISDALQAGPQYNAQSGQRHLSLPCWYDHESGPDLARLCSEKKLSQQELIALHSERDYRVYAIGFTPGFPYLGPVDGRLASARLSSPRLKVAWGSVGIADTQTGIYPSASPGGWNIIGRCPIPLFYNDQEKPSLLEVGDTVQFEPVSRSQYLRLLKEYKREP